MQIHVYHGLNLEPLLILTSTDPTFVHPTSSPSSFLVIMRYFTVMLGSWEGTLGLIRVNNLLLPSERVSAGFSVSIDVDSRRRWKSVVLELSSYESKVSSDIVILSLRGVPELSMEINLPYELGRMLGNGEVVAKLETLWNELLDCEDEPFDILFPSVRGDHSSLTLKTVIIHPCDNQGSALLDSIVGCEIARVTDAGHKRLATYVTSKAVSHLNDAVQHFQLVLGQCLVGHLDQAATLSSLGWARLQDYIYIFKTTSTSSRH